MKIIAIVATDLNGAIGNKNQLLYKCKTDMRHFTETTTGHTVIMGRKTFESIGKPLKDRTNIVLSNSTDFASKGIIVCSSIADALGKVDDNATVFICGGAEIYKHTLPLWNELILTVFNKKPSCANYADAYLPEWYNDSWKLKSQLVFSERTFKGNIFYYEREK